VIANAAPAPNLDDRRFQDLVDEAKRYVQQRCPDWTDHNVSDPGVTLIELFAQMTDQIVYRLNRVPDRNYIKFLDLIGIRRQAAVSAHVPVTFWLAAIPTEERIIPSGTETATRRTETEEAIEYSTTADLRIIPVAVQTVRSSIEPDRYRSHDDDVIKEQGFACFEQVPKPGNALYIGLNDAAPSNAIVLEMRCSVEGIGVDPLNPPLVWEAWSSEGWVPCDLDSDTTGALNTTGRVTLHLPHNHEASIIGKSRAGWLRARVLDVDDDRPKYSASPMISSIRGHTIGGTSNAVHARFIDIDELGTSDGSPGQVFTINHQPVARNAATTLEVSNATQGWEIWREVATFGESNSTDQHFILDGTSCRCCWARWFVMNKTVLNNTEPFLREARRFVCVG
jgi:predicted phage baseplate assembly protein